MADPGALVECLDRLLYDAAYRSAFIERGLVGGVRAADHPLAPHLARVDVRELAQVGSRIRAGVLSGGGGTGAGLRGHFGAALPAATAATGWTERELTERFIASRQFTAFRDVPFSALGRGRTLAEAFYGFAVADLPGELEPLVLHEAVTGAMKVFAAGGGATFEIGFDGLHEIGPYRLLHRVDAEPVAQRWGLAAQRVYLVGERSFVAGALDRTGLAPLVDGLQLVADGDGHRCPPTLLERLRRWGML
ncbi:MAG: hypothetical protein ACT4RN_09940 [Pseudonocardia sp.]